jgi:hypothetical protein
MSKISFGSGKWCVLGDFNVVLHPEERRGVNESSSSNLEVSGFRNFLNEVELVDLSILGRRFTW